MERLSDAIRQKHARGNRCEEIDAAIAALVARQVAISALTSALQIADMANRHWDEDRIAFILLAETRIHEAGTWPPDIPYPIPRRTDGSFPTTIRNASSDTPLP